MKRACRRSISRKIVVRCVVVCAIACTAAVHPTDVSAQQPPQPARPAQRLRLTLRGFGDVGLTRFAAADTFDATLGSPSGVFVGAGVEVVTARRLFANLRFSHFQKSGERVFVDDEGEVFPLGIELKAALTPIEISAGYRFQARGRARNIIPYAGGGIGWHRYSESSEFGDTSEDAAETFTGYHALGGIEFRRGRLWSLAGEAQWTVVPDAFGSSVSSAAAAFDETNLGGFGIRVRFVLGR